MFLCNLFWILHLVFMVSISDMTWMANFPRLRSGSSCISPVLVLSNIFYQCIWWAVVTGVYFHEQSCSSCKCYLTLNICKLCGCSGFISFCHISGSGMQWSYGWLWYIVRILTRALSNVLIWQVHSHILLLLIIQCKLTNTLEFYNF